jgi:flagellar hook-length control protein FliK
MPTIDFNQMAALPVTELKFSDSSATDSHENDNRLFDDYLQRASDTTSSKTRDDRTANVRDDVRDAPSKSEHSSVTERRDAASSSNTSDDMKTSKEATSTFDDKKTSESDSSDSSGGTSNDAPKSNEAKNEETKDGDEAQDKGTVKDEEKGGDKELSKDATAESAVNIQQNAVALTAIPVEIPVDMMTHNAMPIPTDSQGEAKVDPQAIDPAIKSTTDGKTIPQALPGATGELPQMAANVAGNAEIAASTPQTQEANGFSEGKSKSKKVKEAVAEAKDEKITQKTADAKHANRVDAAISEPNGSTTSQDVGKTAATTVASGMASSSMMQAVVELLKNAEKSSDKQDSVSSITDIRANTASSASKSSQGRENAVANASGGTDNSWQTLRAQFVQRVERAFAAMGNRQGTVRLKLSPEELGVLKIEIGVEKGVMNARIEAETPAAKSLLLDNLPELRERLAQQNIQIQRFDVDLADRSAGGMSQQTFGQSDSGSQQQNRSPRRTNEQEIGPVGTATASSQRPGMGGSLNIIV